MMPALSWLGESGIAATITREPVGQEMGLACAVNLTGVARASNPGGSNIVEPISLIPGSPHRPKSFI
jgi:hypothetical protein